MPSTLPCFIQHTCDICSAAICITVRICKYDTVMYFSILLLFFHQHNSCRIHEQMEL